MIFSPYDIKHFSHDAVKQPRAAVCIIKHIDSWTKNMADNTNRKKETGELDQLFQRVGKYRNGRDLDGLFKFIKKFRKMAPYNAMLLHMQRPGSIYVASAEDWESRFNRTVKPEARPLVLLKPFGPVKFVFDVLDTEGPDPFPEDILEPFKISDEEHEYECYRALNSLIRRIVADGVSYHEMDGGSAQAGRIQTASVRQEAEYCSYVMKTEYNLLVNRNLGIVEKFVTVLHELGHLYCGHLGTVDIGRWPDRRREDSLKVREFEAESVSWLVCSRMGIDSKSEKYLSDYLEGNEPVPPISLDEILKAAGMIEARINSYVSPCKSLIARVKETRRR